MKPVVGARSVKTIDVRYTPILSYLDIANTADELIHASNVLDCLASLISEQKDLTSLSPNGINGLVLILRAIQNTVEHALALHEEKTAADGAHP